MKKNFGVVNYLVFLLILSNNIAAQISVTDAFPGKTFSQPVEIQNSGDDSGRLFIVSQDGMVHVMVKSGDKILKKTFLDIRRKVLSGGEQGLLGLAFHPDYKKNGYFYVNYTTDKPRRTIISRYSVSDNPDLADNKSELILLEVSQPYSNHNGGQISFGPDDYLYISLGDGGSAGDPQDNGQNLNSLLGKILRIDVDKTGSGKNYSIPDDNPLKNNNNGYREEIYAWGLRNVWRFSFDSETGELWAGDVGQNAWEEIDIIEKGKNYGWRIMEGFHCFNPASDCNQKNLVFPIWEYGHNEEGGYSITGGFVYRGKNVPYLYGKYIYGDFVTGNLWALDAGKKPVQNEVLLLTRYAISTFGVDENNELYFADYAGRILKIISASDTGAEKTR